MRRSLPMAFKITPASAPGCESNAAELIHETDLHRHCAIEKIWPVPRDIDIRSIGGEFVFRVCKL